MAWNPRPPNNQGYPGNVPTQGYRPQVKPQQQQSYGLRYTYPAFTPSVHQQAGPPPGVDVALWRWFQTVDDDRSGGISADELQRALLNGNWSNFNGETCRLMIGMFDKDRSGSIDIYEFAALWKYIQEWKNCFDRFDTDRSGTIDAGELRTAFTSFGYNLSPQFSNLCVQKFDRSSIQSMKFDDFIQCCVMLKSLTDAFRKHDKKQSGIVHINYEQFLEMVFDHTLTGV